MKSILLTTTALVAFAGAAVAEVSFSGEAALGYNDEPFGDNEGFYWDGNLAVSLTQALDNGVTAGVEFDFDFSDTSLGDVLESGGYVLSLTTENAGLFFGDVAFAAETHWTPTGWMQSDKFSEADGETAIRGDVTVGGFDTSISYVVTNNNGTETQENDVDQLSLGASGDFGNFNISLAYQAESDEAAGFYTSDDEDEDFPTGDNGDFRTAETYGISVGTTFAGASVRLAYADNSVTDSVGISASYPVGPVTLSAAYVLEDGDDDSWRVRAVYADGPISLTANYEERVGVARYNIEGAYDLGNGLTIGAGYIDRDNWDDEAYYIAGTYDLGGGAELLVSYAVDDSNDSGDEVGAPEYQIGTTVEVSFKF
ncbi:MAG: porin [Loktanella sp.]|nr:porin [Loktanella sp.]